MSKVFITGVAGFLGSHLADHMLKNGHTVSGCDNLIGGYTDNVPKGVDFYQFDMKNYYELEKSLKNCDIVYHTACTAYEGLSVFSPSLITANTIQISVNAITAAIKNKVKRFIHCSSMARYGNLGEVAYTEDMECRPQDPYGIAKYSAELLLKNLSDIHNIELVIAVPHNIVGPRQKYDDPYRNVVSIMINLMLQGRRPVIYGDGKQTRCFSDIRDDVNCLYKLAFEQSAVGEVFNIGPDEEPITINKLFELVANATGFNSDPVYFKGRPQEVKHATCSADKIRKYFNYKTNYSTKDMIENTVNYIKERGTKEFLYHLPIELDNSEILPETWKEKLF